MLLQRSLSLVLAVLLVIGPMAPASGGEVEQVRVVVDNANVRAEPSLEGRVLTRAPRGAVLRVVDELKDWYLVTAPGMEPGYVSRTVVRRMAARVVEAPLTGGAPAPAATKAQAPPAATVPTISHVPLACLAAEDNPLVLADVTAQAQVHRSRVYFKAHQYPDWYYVDMKVADQPHYQALLPQPLPGTEKVDYYIHALDTALETARTDQYEPEVRKSGCRPDERAAARVGPEANELVIGGTKDGQPPIPPGFSKKGIFAFVAVTGAVITGAALLTTATTATATAAATAATSAALTTAGTATAATTTAAGSGAAGTAAASGTAAAAGGGGMSGGAIAGIVAGGVLVAGGVAGGVYLATKGDELTCVSASELASQSGGSIVAVGSDTICTTWEPCGRRTVRACAEDYCSESSCSLYYQFSDGARVNCTSSCGGGDVSGIYSCASTAARYCQ